MKPVSPNFTTQRLLTTVAILVVITFLALGVKAFSKTPASQTAATTTPSAATSKTVDSGQTTGTYKDGTYIASGTYDSPGGKQSVDVSLTLAGNKVTGSTVTPKATDGVATLYQSSFVEGYKKLVVGKNLNEIKVKRVSGSSLTSNGFNEALKQIKTQAKA